jgi:nucleoside-diphosphate-sugar epimerase
VLVADKRADSTRARAELGYAPHAPLDDAVRAMVDGFVSSGAVTRRQLA